MAGYNVTARSLDQSGPSSRFVLAVSVFDSNGSGVTNLSESNFTVHNITSDARFTIGEVHSIGTQGFYRLFLRTESIVQVGECVLALVVTSRHHVTGRVPGNLDGGSAMVKVRVV